VAAAALAVAGCSVGPSATPEIVYTAPPAADTAGIGETPSVDTIAITSSAPDNTWTATFKKPVLSGVSDAILTKMNDAITAKVNGYIHDFTGGSLPGVASGAAPSTLEGDFSVAMTSPTIVSLRFSILTTLSGSGKLVAQPGASISGFRPALRSICRSYSRTRRRPCRRSPARPTRACRPISAAP